MASTSWIVAQSEQALKHNVHLHSKRQLYDNIKSKDILPRRLKFVSPSKHSNARPMSAASTSSASSTASSVAPMVGRQHSGFNEAAYHLFEESKIPPLMNWKRSTNEVGAGLRNLGNSCFMNATLQCLCYTAPFQNYIASDEHRKRCRTGGFCIFCELQKLMPTMLQNQGTAVPQTVFRNLGLLSKKLRPGRQEDAQEFLRFLMEGLQNACLKQEGKKIKDMRIQETTVIHKMWGGYLRSQIKCCKCGYESNTYDSILDISLEIKGPSVRTAFKHFTDPEILDDDNKYRCDNCKKKRKAIKQFTIFEPPNVLVVHLKRFECGGGGLFSGGKINKHVKFDETLDLTEFMSYNICPKVSYSLFGVLVHYGYSSHGGHYVSYIKAPDNEWYLMDDSSVRRQSLSAVLKEKAYLLFYQRNEHKVLYQSPTHSPKLKHKITAPPSPPPSPPPFDTSFTSFDSLKELAQHLPKPQETSPLRSGAKKRMLSDSFDISSSSPAKKQRSNESSPRVAPSKHDIFASHSSKINRNKSSRDRFSKMSLEDSLSSSEDRMLDFQKDKANGNEDEHKSSSPISGQKKKSAGEKRCHEDTSAASMPCKKRKIDDSEPMSIQQQLRLLKEKQRRTKSAPICVTPRSMSTASSSASSSQSVEALMRRYQSVHPKSLRRISANKYIGRRSHTLCLAAKTALHVSSPNLNKQTTARSSPRMWKRRSFRTRSDVTHQLSKGMISVALSDSSSESVLSDLVHKQTSFAVSDDSSDSVSPLNAYTANNNMNTTLPSHDGTSPKTALAPTPSLPSSLVALGKNGTLPKRHITATTTASSALSSMNSNSANKSVRKTPSSSSTHTISSKPSNSSLISDRHVIEKYLKDDASSMSAIGVSNVASWSDEEDNGRAVRRAIVQNARQPLVEPKDEWDLALDTGTAYPRKIKKARDPFKDSHRNGQQNKFQGIQNQRICGENKLKHIKKKKHSPHNEHRYQSRQRNNGIKHFDR
eukprot:CAMPEP_0197031480 /NCGR_PEP_ID=MMETSP1384-20130603/10476_1 /TAXON_ID=29189 /ORGANISM="Ammonia sp." /LENGTH=986 /DNA_ID=CAMNT_0042461013 /DNA_START=30 /DNA_END=2990 /DNA_ORIENTATION=+